MEGNTVYILSKNRVCMILAMLKVGVCYNQKLLCLNFLRQAFL